MFKLGVQIYSVRNEYAADPLSCFKQMKAFGYDGAELFGSIKTHPAEQLKAWLAEAGLEICGYHTQVAEIREDIDAVIAYNRTLGNRFVIVDGSGVACFLPRAERVQKHVRCRGLPIWIPFAPQRGPSRRRRQPALGYRRRRYGRRLHPSNRYGQYPQRRRAAGGTVQEIRLARHHRTL